MSLLLYLGAVFRHWSAAISGFAALALGTAIRWQWAWTHWVTPDSAEFWWLVGAACLLIATFQAWLDEHDARVTAEGRGPRVVLEFQENDTNRDAHHWRVTNTGAVDALNVTSDEITVEDAAVKVERIARLGAGQS